MVKRNAYRQVDWGLFCVLVLSPRVTTANVFATATPHLWKSSRSLKRHLSYAIVFAKNLR